MLRVVIAAEWGQHKGTRWQIGSGESKLFGRSERADVVVTNDNLFSSTHFRIFADEHACMVEDLQSTNGTFVNNQKVALQTLRDGDKVRAGRSVFEIRIEVVEPVDVIEPVELESPIVNEPASSGNTDISNAESKDEGSQTFTATVANEDAVVKPLIESYTLSAPNRVFFDVAPVFTTPPPGIHFQESPVPTNDFMVELRQCPSGLWRGTKVKANLDPATIVDYFSEICAMVYIIDVARTGLDEASSVEAFPLLQLPRQSTATRFIRPAGFEQRELWVRQGWGRDGFTALFTFVDVAEVVGRFQHAMLELEVEMPSCSSEFERLMRVGSVELVRELIQPCEAILFDSPNSPGGWTLMGDDRLRRLLVDCNISFCEVA